MNHMKIKIFLLLAFYLFTDSVFSQTQQLAGSGAGGRPDISIPFCCTHRKWHRIDPEWKNYQRWQLRQNRCTKIRSDHIL